MWRTIIDWLRPRPALVQYCARSHHGAWFSECSPSASCNVPGLSEARGAAMWFDDPEELRLSLHLARFNPDDFDLIKLTIGRRHMTQEEFYQW